MSTMLIFGRMARKASVKFDEWFMFRRHAMRASVYRNFSRAAVTVMAYLLRRSISQTIHG
jgi:hypothetical protein